MYDQQCPLTSVNRGLQERLRLRLRLLLTDLAGLALTLRSFSLLALRSRLTLRSLLGLRSLGLALRPLGLALRSLGLALRRLQHQD